MTQTTYTGGGGPRPTAPENPYKPFTPRSPELRAVLVALRGMRQDLLRDVLAYRPLPALPADGGWVGRLPPGARRYAVWTPHAVVAALAWIALFCGITTGRDVGAPLTAVTLVVPPAAVLLTLVRPVAAFWVSLASTPALAVLGGSAWQEWPWQPGGFAAHLFVLTVVALRTRPRTAAWMWLLTAAYAAVADLGRNVYYGSNTTPMLFLSALSLLVVTLRQVRRAAAHEVTAQQSVTERERSRRTQLEERTTIARELHDVVAHHMSVVAIQAEAAPYRVQDPPPELERAFATIRENAVAALAELRRVLGVVRAEDACRAPDAPQPTLADLDALLANVRDAGLAADKAVTGAVRPLPQGVELSAYRIVQEALSNVLRHAPGAAARVEVGYVIGGLGLRVVNDPPPTPNPVEPSPGAGHGITGMRERVSMLGGEMTAGPTGRGGYEVTVFLPFAAAGVDGAGA